MFEGLGFYILFLFKLCLAGVLSLIINYLYKEDAEDSKTLRIYSVLSLIVVALVTITENYSINKEISILPFIIVSIFLILGVFLFNHKKTRTSFLKLVLLFSNSIFIALGYYVSSITFIVILFLIDYFFEGIFVFFTDKEKETFIENEDDFIDLIDKEDEIINKE